MNSLPLPSELIKQAQAAYQREDFHSAAEFFFSAAEQFRAANDLVNAAEMQNNRSVALLKAGDAKGALAAAQGTESVFANVGDSKRQAMALANQASAQEELKNLDAAFDLFTRSSDLFKAAGEKEMRSYVLQRISNIQMRRGDRLEAVATMQTALDSRKKKSLKDRFLKGLIETFTKMLGPK